MAVTRKVLFVCAHNAARSRMAESFLRWSGGERFEASSAGSEADEVDPLVVEAMKAIGVPLASSAPQPTVFELFKAGRYFNYVISVCDEMQGEKCPVFPGVAERLHWSFPDPAAFIGNRDERLARTIEVRDAIRARVEAWVASFGSPTE